MSEMARRHKKMWSVGKNAESNRMVGTNGSTLRPKSTLARGVNGKSSGAVSWLNDIANLTHLVEQGGSRRGRRPSA